LDGENNKNAKLLMENIIKKKIVWWPEEYNTAFQYTTENDETWIHYDPTNWAAVLYLTPDAPLDSGTAIYMHNETKIYMLDRNDPKTWEFDGFQKSFGFVGHEPLCQPQIWKNRAHPKIYKVFKSMYELTSGHELK
jgi:hypothetical protein